MYYDVKSKISNTLVQLTLNCFETKRTVTKFDRLEKMRRMLRKI